MRRGPLVRLATGRALYGILLAAAVLVNAAGYLLNLWHDETAFDEAVHLYTSFAVVAALGRLAIEKPTALGGLLHSWALLLAGIGLGVAWEVFEWVIGIIGSRRDTVMDLLMDTAGAAIAAALVAWARKRATQSEDR